MDPATISMLITTLGPIVIPILANALTWGFNKLLGAMSPAHQQLVSPFLPVLAGAVGTALGATGGMTGIIPGGGAIAGLVGGLAGTGMHQVVHQVVKAGKATPVKQVPPPLPKPA